MSKKNIFLYVFIIFLGLLFFYCEEDGLLISLKDGNTNSTETNTTVKNSSTSTTSKSTTSTIGYVEYPDPSFITSTNYNFDGYIALTRAEADTLNNGQSKTSNLFNTLVYGIVLNNYDASTSGTYINGFFIQDKNAGIFVANSTSSTGIIVKRGDKVIINIQGLRKSGSTGDGQLQIINTTSSDINIISSNNIIYCKNVIPPTSNTNPSNGAIFVKMKGIISKKNNADDATWGLDNNTWGIRIPVTNQRTFPNIKPGDTVTVFGIVDWYTMQIAGGDVSNKYCLWVYDTQETVFDNYQ